MPKLRVGDLVVVRSANEILRTLDDNGALDGLPFMPEMVSWCGRIFRVQRQVLKTCVDGHALRVFPSNDVVVLNGPRCDGSGHDGCKHGCRIYWKESWLRPAGDGETETVDYDVDELKDRLKIKTDEIHYFCQSTELYKSTREATIKGSFKRLRIAASNSERRSARVSRFTAVCDLLLAEIAAAFRLRRPFARQSKTHSEAVVKSSTRRNRKSKVAGGDRPHARLQNVEPRPVALPRDDEMLRARSRRQGSC